MARGNRRKRVIGGICLLLAGAICVTGGVFYGIQASQKTEIIEEQKEEASSYGDVISRYLQAFINEDGEALANTMAPEEYWDFYMQLYSKSADDVLEIYNEACATTKEEWQNTYGPDVSVSFQIISMSQQDAEAVAEWNQNWEDSLGNSDLNITEAITVQVEVKFSGSVSEGTQMMYPQLGKFNDSWYILDEGYQEEETTE